MSVRIYRQWSQGSSAAGDPAVGEYNSVNAQVYENGTLGPRPGWKVISDSDGTRVYDPSSDSLKGIAWYRETDDDEHLALIFYDGANKFDTLPLASPTWVAGQTLSNQGTGGGNLLPPNWDDSNRISTFNDGSILTALGPHILIASNSSIGTIVATTTADGDAQIVTLYRERAYYWGMTTAPGRVYYSDAADWSTVGATSSFEVNVDVDEWAGAPVGMWSVKNALLIASKDNRWLVLTGTSPENGSLRELGRDPVPLFNSAAQVDNQLYFLNPTGLGVVVATPSFIESEVLSYMSPLAYPGSTEARPTNDFMPQSGVGDDVNGNIFLPGRKISDGTDLVAVERVNGVFNLSKYTPTLTIKDYVFSRGRPNELYMAASTDEATDDCKLYSRNHTLNRPAHSSDTKSVSLDSESGTSDSEVVVDLGEVAAGPGKVIRPVKVVLDIDYWKGGNYSAPELAIDATVLGTEATTPEDALAQVAITTTGWQDTSGNVPYKRRVPVALPQGQFGTRFKIRLTFDNLALDNVQVYYDEQEDTR